jgi:glycosyltransferase involved in cell wall biosynthesis
VPAEIDEGEPRMRKVTVLLPGYNVARHLDALVGNLRAALPDAELLLVDDGSADDTAATGRALGLTVIEHEINQGKGMALRTGFEAAVGAGAEAVITMDSDGQHLASEAGRFVDAWEEGADVVVGDRMADNDNMPWLRKRTNEFTSWVISRVAGARIPDSQNGYRLFDAEVLRSVKLESRRYDMESEILIRAARQGYRIASVPISTIYHDEESSINPFVDTFRFFRLVWRARGWR